MPYWNKAQVTLFMLAKSKKLKILVTRPSLFAESLCSKISEWGAIPILFPTIEISKTPNTALLNQQLKTLDQNDIAIFTSRSAVLYGMQAIRKRFSTIPKLVFAAIGQGTAIELRDSGISDILYPKTPPYESEALLALPEFQDIKDKKIIIFRGNEGRMLLYETLKARAASVTLCETYQRTLPRHGKIEFATIASAKSENVATAENKPVTTTKNEITKIQTPDVIVVTSPQCLTNLKKLVGEALWVDFQQYAFILVGWRTYLLSATLGIRHRFLAEGADDTNIIHSLTQVRDSWQ